MSLVALGVICALLGLVVGAGALYLINHLSGEKLKASAAKEADRILQKAKGQAAKIERDANGRAKDFETRARRNAEAEINKQKQQIQSTENRLKDKEAKLEKDYRRLEEQLNNKLRELDDRDEKLKVAEQRIKDMEGVAQNQIEDLRRKLEGAANMSAEQAREELRLAIEDQARAEAHERLTKIEEDARKEADVKARRILSVAISRYASEVATERTVSIVALSSDEMKGKIIGREGRNIRALEAACGVDLIIDETPEAVVISSFDAVRREIARQTLERLMEDGRVHPARIEEVVDKVKTDLFNAMKEDGEKACIDLGLSGIHGAIASLIGSLKYRHTQTQNLYAQSLDVAYVAGLIANEIGFDVKLARRAGLLHGIGRAIDHTVEGDYSTVGADFAKKHGEREDVCQAIRSHNGTVEPRSILDHILQAAFNLIESRPGVRRNMVDNYIRRLQDLESVANSFDGVQRTFAIQSGKEIRVLVDSGKITDDQSRMLSRDIARKIERELSYPGQVKVTVVRETRIVEHAR